ncbi:MAG: glutamate 5-kinase [Elusimicrobiota bacterium]
MRIVVKSGSAIISHKKGGLDPSAVAHLAKQLASLHKKGHEVILVTSGAIAAGVARLGLHERPTELRAKQASAAVGQLVLMEAYEKAFSRFGITPAQILLTREDLTHKERYLNVKNTLLHLLSLKAIPIINENDSVSTAEIQFGDNDTLSAVVATKVHADKLILLSDVKGLYEVDESGKLTEKVIPVVKKVTAQMQKSALTVKGSKMSVGGIVTKLTAAKMATTHGIETWLASGYESDVLSKILNKQAGAGTCFNPKRK